MTRSGTTCPVVATPMFFASRSHRLMGVLHAADPASRRGIGVVICNQVGPDYGEYYKTGRAFLGMLTAAGIDCLRFDYAGCGDSEGDYNDASVTQWLDDIAVAAELLRKSPECSRICLCGFGFGGLLAARAAGSDNADMLLLWDPVTDGATYCRSLQQKQKQWLRGSFAKAERLDRQIMSMGFPAGGTLVNEMSMLKLDDVECHSAKDIFLVAQEDSPDAERIESYCRDRVGRIERCKVAAGALPLRPMRSAVAWLKGMADDA